MLIFEEHTSNYILMDGWMGLGTVTRDRKPDRLRNAEKYSHLGVSHRGTEAYRSMHT